MATKSIAITIPNSDTNHWRTLSKCVDANLGTNTEDSVLMANDDVIKLPATNGLRNCSIGVRVVHRQVLVFPIKGVFDPRDTIRSVILQMNAVNANLAELKVKHIATGDYRTPVAEYNAITTGTTVATIASLSISAGLNTILLDASAITALEAGITASDSVLRLGYMVSADEASVGNEVTQAYTGSPKLVVTLESYNTPN